MKVGYEIFIHAPGKANETLSKHTKIYNLALEFNSSVSTLNYWCNSPFTIAVEILNLIICIKCEITRLNILGRYRTEH